MNAFSPLLEMLGHDFMRNAFLVASAMALAGGLAGYFLVLRNQVFAADALGHVAFTGALAALVLGVSELAGAFGLTVLAAAFLSGMTAGSRAGDVVIGSFFAWVLGLGVLFLSLYVTTRSGSTNGAAGVTVLFGSVFGVGPAQARLSAAIGAGATAALLAIGRPLLFASVDDAAAAAYGVGVRAISLVFLLLVAVIVAEAVQVVGALLILGVFATPAAIAQRLTPRPYLGMMLSAGTALLGVWAGLTISYAVPHVPPSFAVTGVLFAGYVGVAGAGSLRLKRSGTR